MLSSEKTIFVLVEILEVYCKESRSTRKILPKVKNLTLFQHFLGDIHID